MADIKEASKSITDLLRGRALVLGQIVLLAKIASAVFAAILAVSKFADLPAAVGWISAVGVLTSALVVLRADKDASSELSKARLALDAALDKERELEEVSRKQTTETEFYKSEIERLLQLQLFRDVVRTILEGAAISTKKVDEILVIEQILQLARRSLVVAHGFSEEDFYTICVYTPQTGEDGKIYLHCRAHIRTTDCDVKQARKWKEGVGAAGTSFARREEVVVPDLTSSELGSLLKLPELKDGDTFRYGSIVAEPIQDGVGPELWGVLTVTSRFPDHFSLTDRSYVDVSQSLAGMIGLAVKLVRTKNQEIQATTQARP